MTTTPAFDSSTPTREQIAAWLLSDGYGCRPTASRHLSRDGAAEVTITTAPVKRVSKRHGLGARRRKVLVRDGYRCQYCGIDLLSSPDAFDLATVDHIQPRRVGGGSGPRNLVACCWSCNRLKGGTPVTSLEEARELVNRRRLDRAIAHAQYIERVRPLIEFARGLRAAASPDIADTAPINEQDGGAKS